MANQVPLPVGLAVTGEAILEGLLFVGSANPAGLILGGVILASAIVGYGIYELTTSKSVAEPIMCCIQHKLDVEEVEGKPDITMANFLALAKERSRDRKKESANCCEHKPVYAGASNNPLRRSNQHGNNIEGEKFLGEMYYTPVSNMREAENALFEVCKNQEIDLGNIMTKSGIARAKGFVYVIIMKPCVWNMRKNTKKLFCGHNREQQQRENGCGCRLSGLNPCECVLLRAR